MEIEDKRIFLLGQIALFNAEIEMMKAENSHREMQGLSQAYGEEQFASLIKQYEGTIGHNAVIEYLRK